MCYPITVALCGSSGCLSRFSCLCLLVLDGIKCTIFQVCIVRTLPLWVKMVEIFQPFSTLYRNLGPRLWVPKFSDLRWFPFHIFCGWTIFCGSQFLSWRCLKSGRCRCVFWVDFGLGGVREGWVLWRGYCGDSSLINKVVTQTFAFKWAAVLLSTVACFFCGWVFRLPQNFWVMWRNYYFHVWCCSVTEFHRLSVNYFAEVAWFGEVFVN